MQPVTLIPAAPRFAAWGLLCGLFLSYGTTAAHYWRSGVEHRLRNGECISGLAMRPPIQPAPRQRPALHRPRTYFDLSPENSSRYK